MEPVRLGVIGCGVIGKAHLTAAASLPEHYRIVAVADPVRERAAEAKAKYGAAKVYRSGNALIDRDDEVEMVILAYPARGRARMTIRAFRRGKHVLTEKPVAMNAREVRRMIEARGDCVGGCCQCRCRLYDHALAAARFLATGPLGKIRLVRVRDLVPSSGPPKRPPPPWRLNKRDNGGGILVNWGCYDLDYVLGLTGWSLRPQWALAQTWTVPPMIESHVPAGSDAETYFAALIRCEGGEVISFERGEYMPCSQDEAWQILGDRGSLRLRMKPSKDKTVVHDELTPDRGVVSHVVWRGDEGWQTGPALLKDFAEAVRDGRPPLGSLDKALLVQQITDAIFASAARGRAVKVAT